MTEKCQICGLPLNDQGLCTTPGCSAAAAGQSAPRASTAPAAGAAGAVDADAQLARLKTLYQRRQRKEMDCEFVTICGFPTAGKTWLTPRLEKDLINRRRWQAEMDEREADDSAANTIKGTKKMGGTGGLLIHHLEPPRGKKARAIILIDIPGERFTELIEGSQGADLPLPLLAALAISDRIVLTLPSDVCVIGSLLHRDIHAEPDQYKRDKRVAEILGRDTDKLEKDREDLAAQLRDWRAGEDLTDEEEYAAAYAQFTAISLALNERRLLDQWEKLTLFGTRIRRVFGRASYLAYEIGRDRFFDLPADQWLADYDQKFEKYPRALTSGSYAVLTKADRVLPVLSGRDFGFKPGIEWEHLPERAANCATLEASGWSDALAPYISDPRLMLSMIMDDLVSKLDGWLPNLRYEWASADWQASGWSVEMDMGNDCAGITQLTDWLCDGAPTSKATPAAVASVASLRALIEQRHQAEGAA